MEEIDPNEMERLEMPEYGMIAERIVELKMNLNEEPDLKTLERTVKYNPKNERITKYIVEEGTKKLEGDELERAVKYFEVVPERHDDLQFLKSYGEALEKSKKYRRAAEVFEELSSRDPNYFLQLAECNQHLGGQEDVVRNLKDLFRYSATPPVLEE